MKIGQSIKYTTKGGSTHTITRHELKVYGFGFDCAGSLEAAKKTLEWIDNPRRSY